MSTSTARPLTRFAAMATTWSEAFVHSRPSCSWSGQANTRPHSSSAVATCVVPRYAVRTARPWLVRVRRTYSAAPPEATLWYVQHAGGLVRVACTEALGRTCQHRWRPRAPATSLWARPWQTSQAGSWSRCLRTGGAERLGRASGTPPRCRAGSGAAAAARLYRRFAERGKVWTGVKRTG